MKVTLIATVLDATDHVGAFLADIAAQTRAPDEIVIVDGGSVDGTLEILRADPSITMLVEQGANIARGRNLALGAATHDVIAVADADCTYGPTWLEELLRPIEAGADVAMGWYQPVIGSFLDACVTGHVPLDPSEVDEAAFMPSARSVAFRRDALEAIGGYPEWLPIGEDMWVNHRWRERDLDMRFAPDAVAGWHPRPSLGATWRQYLRYARGDAQAGMYPERHAIRFATYAGLAVALTSRRTWPKLLVVAGALVYAGPQIRRARARARSPRERAAAVAAVPAVVAFIDVAKMAGYLAGLADRLRAQRSYV
jgi:glycosyltransferase involved in cell wall biosynthesis